jgi:hypothetical protein
LATAALLLSVRPSVSRFGFVADGPSPAATLHLLRLVPVILCLSSLLRTVASNLAIHFSRLQPALETKAGGTESPELQPVFQVELLLPVVALESHQGYYFQIPMARQQFSVVVIELRSSHTPLSYTYLYTYLHTCTHTYTTHASHVTYNTCQRVWPPASTCVLHPAYPHRIPSHNNLALFLHRS